VNLLFFVTDSLHERYFAECYFAFCQVVAFFRSITVLTIGIIMTPSVSLVILVLLFIRYCFVFKVFIQ
jgi:hypothetical protein